MTIKELAIKMRSINVNELMGQAVKENEKALTDLNREQLRRGVAEDGNLITPDLQNTMYADAKKQAGGMAPFLTPDLYLTGSFQERMLMKSDSKSYSFTSTDEKTTKLAKKYAGIFGLTVENKERARAINTKKLGQLYKQATGL